jgi:hypothetical protein
LNSGHLKPLCQPFLWCFFRERVSGTICLDWLRTAILLISVYWVARITGVSHQRPAYHFLRGEIDCEKDSSFSANNHFLSQSIWSQKSEGWKVTMYMNVLHKLLCKNSVYQCQALLVRQKQVKITVGIFFVTGR